LNCFSEEKQRFSPNGTDFKNSVKIYAKYREEFMTSGEKAGITIQVPLTAHYTPPSKRIIKKAVPLQA
jgi:hypothetical protein